MPRAVDPSLQGGGLPITHSPLSRINYNVIPQEFDLAAWLEEVFEGTLDMITGTLFPAIEELTGIDLSALLPLLQLLELDFSSPEAFLQSLVNAIMGLPAALAQLVVGLVNQLTAPSSSDALTSLITGIIQLLVSLPAMLVQLGQSLLESGAGLLGIESPLNLLNAFNILPPELAGLIDFSSIGEFVTNLIEDPLFLVEEAFDVLDDWFNIPDFGFGGNGNAAHTVADGTAKELLGNLIPVSVGQVMPISGKAKWTGLAGTGNPIMLAVTGYNSADAAIDQTTIASHNTIPTTTDWITMSGTYTVPADVKSVRVRLAVGATATAGDVYFSDMAATKSQNIFQRLIAGTDPGTLLPDDIGNLFTGIITNTLGLLDKLDAALHFDLLDVLGGDLGDIDDRLNDFLNSLSPLNGDNILSGNIGDEFIGGIGTMLDNVVNGFLNIPGSGFGHVDFFDAFRHGSFVDTDTSARLAKLENLLTGGIAIQDDFERTSTTNIGPNWVHIQTGAGKWCIANGHDAQWVASGLANAEFIEIWAGTPTLSTTDLQRVTAVMSSKATSAFGNYAGNDLWLRVSDATTTLANVTGIRVRFRADWCEIARFVSGTYTQLAIVSGLTPPGPGSMIWAEAGTISVARFFRAGIGTSALVEHTEVGTASGVGSTCRRWGHGGFADGSVITQERPGGLHHWTAKDQVT